MGYNDDTTTETHYTAHLSVKRVDKVTPKRSTSQMHNPTPNQTAEREIQDMGQFSISDSDLVNLKKRLSALIDVVEEI